MQDAVAVHVFGRVVAGDAAIGGAGGDDRDLALESHEALEDERDAAELGKGAIGAIGG